MGIMLFLVPALVIYLVFQIIPIIGSIYFSLVDWNGIAGSAPKFVGLKNYISVMVESDGLKNIINSIVYVVLSLLLAMPIGIGVGTLLN